jgi:hypothetical protein
MLHRTGLAWLPRVAAPAVSYSELIAPMRGRRRLRSRDPGSDPVGDEHGSRP